MIRLNGVPAEPALDAEIVETEPGVYSVLENGRQYEIRLSGNQMIIDGYCFNYEIEDPRQWKRSRPGMGESNRASITAPMPGKVVRLLVAVGDQVTAGQGIIVVEAMKMQNEIRSPLEGRVTAILAEQHSGVNAGTVLAVIERTP